VYPYFDMFHFKSNNLKFKKTLQPHIHSSTFIGAQKPIAQGQPAKELKCKRTANMLLTVIKTNTFVSKAHKHKSS
jgi:hypothetical protein